MQLRKEIFNLLQQIIIEDGYYNIVLDRYLRETSLAENDQRFLVRVVTGVLQNFEYLEWEISQKSKVKKLKTKSRILLMLSIYQMRFMDRVPDYAIVNDAVEIAKELDGQEGANFINGILRSLIREKPLLKAEDFESNIQYLSIKYSHPEFVISIMCSKFGEETTQKLLEFNHIPADMVFRVNILKTTRENILKNSDFLALNLSDTAVKYLGNEKIDRLEEFKNGFISPQDQASQFIITLLNLTKNDKILDMCAAPGSKTMQMAEFLKNEGDITAVDIHPHRIELLLKGMKRLGIDRINAFPYDSRNLIKKYEPETFDKILLDAPCSGLGVIRRKPDILLRVNPNQIDELVILQYQLLEQAHLLLKKNGLLVYSTCTLTKKENELQIKKFLINHQDMELVEEKQILSFEHNSDCFYYALMRKK